MTVIHQQGGDKIFALQVYMCIANIIVLTVIVCVLWKKNNMLGKTN